MTFFNFKIDSLFFSLIYLYTYTYTYVPHVFLKKKGEKEGIDQKGTTYRIGHYRSEARPTGGLSI